MVPDRTPACVCDNILGQHALHHDRLMVPDCTPACMCDCISKQHALHCDRLSMAVCTLGCVIWVGPCFMAAMFTELCSPFIQVLSESIKDQDWPGDGSGNQDALASHTCTPRVR